MHNKSFTADNRVTIVGGRNVGNEYFGAGEDVLFADLDVMAVGPAVQEVSECVRPLLEQRLRVSRIAARAEGRRPTRATGWRRNSSRCGAEPESRKYVDAVRGTPLVTNLLDGKLDLEWDDARVVRDDPAKTLDTAERHDVLLLTDLLQTFGRPEKSFDLVSPYFVPGKNGTKAISSRWPQRGVSTSRAHQLAFGHRRERRACGLLQVAQDPCSRPA